MTTSAMAISNVERAKKEVVTTIAKNFSILPGILKPTAVMIPIKLIEVTKGVRLLQNGMMVSQSAAVAPIPVKKEKVIVIMTMSAVAISNVETSQKTVITIAKNISILSGILKPTAAMTPIL